MSFNRESGKILWRLHRSRGRNTRGVAPASSHTINGTIRRGACEVNWHRDRWLRGEADRARRYRRRRGDTRALIAVVLLLGLIGFYAYRSWTAKPPAPLTGQARVLDGDSIEISGARIRLQGIDAPEWEQTCADAGGQAWPCGRAAAQELRRHIGARDLRCEASGFVRYNRVLATCFEPDGSDLNAWLVRWAGLWHTAVAGITARSRTRRKPPSAASGREPSCRQRNGDGDTRDPRNDAHAADASPPPSGLSHPTPRQSMIGRRVRMNCPIACGRSDHAHRRCTVSIRGVLRAAGFRAGGARRDPQPGAVRGRRRVR